MALCSSPVSHILRSNMITSNNYTIWSACMKTYLLSQDLWDVIEPSPNPSPSLNLSLSPNPSPNPNPIPSPSPNLNLNLNPSPNLNPNPIPIPSPREWEKKNAAALLAIQNSCESDLVLYIREQTSAKGAWDELAMLNTQPLLNTLRSNMLTSNNYTIWSDCMKNYLLSQDLWDVIEPRPVPRPREWETKNAAALLAIQKSCESDVVLCIREQTSAQNAWDQLAMLNRGIQNIYLPQFQILHEAITNGKLNLVSSLLDENPDDKNARITIFGEIPLHVAASIGHLHIVKYLVISNRDLEMQDGITRNDIMVAIRNNEGAFPLLVACGKGHKDISRYLYSFTPLELLLPENGNYGSSVLGYFIDLKIFDVALHLLRHCPRLVITPNHLGKLPVLSLACSPTAFPSGFKSLQWLRWIYSRIHVQLPPAVSSDNPAVSSGSGNPISSGNPSSGNLVDNPAVSSDNRVNILHITQNDLEVAKVHVFGLPPGPLYSSLGINRLCEMKLMHTFAFEILRHFRAVSHSDIEGFIEKEVIISVFEAIKCGTVEFLKEMIKAYPNLIGLKDMKGRNLLLYAVENRQEKIFNFLCEHARKDILISEVDYFNNNILNLAGMLPPSHQLDLSSAASTASTASAASTASTASTASAAFTAFDSNLLNTYSGAVALQMQKELQWYKKVESIVSPSYKESLNIEGETPRQVFTRNHKDLVKAGEQWMKQTATSGTVIGALITTMVFAAAFTIPGGNNQVTGFPIFLHKKWFSVFIISDAIALFASSTSLLSFLGILSSRYAEDDFLVALPATLIMSLFSLLLCILAMMLAFFAALVLMLEGQSRIIIPIILLAYYLVLTPISRFQFPLLCAFMNSTFGSSIFDRK